MKSLKTLKHFAVASIVLAALNLTIIFLCIPTQHTIIGLMTPQLEYNNPVIPYTNILSGIFNLLWVITFCLLLMMCKNASATVMLLIAILSKFCLAVCELILKLPVTKYYSAQGAQVYASYSALCSAISLLTQPVSFLCTVFIFISFGIAIAIQELT